jgi:hypothetical protein
VTAPHLVTVRRRLADLRHYPGNARRGDTEAIAESLAVNGQFRPLAVQASTGYVLTGNHTMDAAALACVHCPHTLSRHDAEDGARHCTENDGCIGFQPHEELDCVVLDVDDEKARRIVIADNRTSDLGGYDERALLALLRDLGEDLTGTGYDLDDFDDLLASIEEHDADYPPQPPTALIPDGAHTGQAGAYGPEGDGSNVRKTPSYAEYEDQYAARATRFMALNYPLPQHTWIVERLSKIAAEEGVDNFAEAVLRLVEQRTGDTAPALEAGQTIEGPAPATQEEEPGGPGS